MKLYQFDRGMLQPNGTSGSESGMPVIVIERTGIDPEGVMAPLEEVQ